MPCTKAISVLIVSVAILNSPSRAQAPVNEVFPEPICALHFGNSPVMGRISNLGPASPEALALYKRIADIAGVRPEIKLVAADIEQYATAFATIRDGQRYIVYDRSDRNWADGKASMYDLRVMAHEVGHHLAAHVYVDEYSGHEQELEADRFAGYALSRLGATRSTLMKVFVDRPATRYHPSGEKRRTAALEGWALGETLKDKERSQCSAGWQSEEFKIDGNICRIAQNCSQGQSVFRTACQDYDGVWRWK